jgi:hypothetical protein
VALTGEAQLDLVQTTRDLEAVPVTSGLEQASNQELLLLEVAVVEVLE